MIELMHQLYFKADHWSDHLWAHFQSDSGLILTATVYTKVVLTVVFIPTVVYILAKVSSLSVCGQQKHCPHVFHVIFISVYPTVRAEMN